MLLVNVHKVEIESTVSYSVTDVSSHTWNIAIPFGSIKLFMHH